MASTTDLYNFYNLDDERFALDVSATSTSFERYKKLFSDLHSSDSNPGLDILKSDTYNPENFKSLGLVAFFSKGQVEKILGISLHEAPERPGAVGLVATLGLSLDNEGGGDKLYLMIGPGDEVGRIVPAPFSFDQNAVWKWAFDDSNPKGEAVNMSEYQKLRDNFMQMPETGPIPLRYLGFDKLYEITKQSEAQNEQLRYEFEVGANHLYAAIFDKKAEDTPVGAGRTVTFHLIFRDDDTHPVLDIIPGRYLSMALSAKTDGSEGVLAYSGRTTPEFIVYSGHPK